jgi:hypothetical protein
MLSVKVHFNIASMQGFLAARRDPGGQEEVVRGPDPGGR